MALGPKPDSPEKLAAEAKAAREAELRKQETIKESALLSQKLEKYIDNELKNKSHDYEVSIELTCTSDAEDWYKKLDENDKKYNLDFLGKIKNNYLKVGWKKAFFDSTSSGHQVGYNSSGNPSMHYTFRYYFKLCKE